MLLYSCTQRWALQGDQFYGRQYIDQHFRMLWSFSTRADCMPTSLFYFFSFFHSSAWCITHILHRAATPGLPRLIFLDGAHWRSLALLKEAIIRVKSYGEDASGEYAFGKILNTFTYASSFPTQSFSLNCVIRCFLSKASPCPGWYRFHTALSRTHWQRRQKHFISPKRYAIYFSNNLNSLDWLTKFIRSCLMVDPSRTGPPPVPGS